MNKHYDNNPLLVLIGLLLGFATVLMIPISDIVLAAPNFDNSTLGKGCKSLFDTIVKLRAKRFTQGGTLNQKDASDLGNAESNYKSICSSVYGPIPRQADIFQGGPIVEGGNAVQDKPNVTQGGPAWGGIFQGTITPTPGPATQDQPSTAQGEPAAQDTPQSETSGPRQGGILGNWGLFKTSQNQETSSEEDVIAEPPATEETQPAIINEEPIPHCPGAQLLDEESGLCVLEETQGEEQPEEENQESENNGSEDGDAEEASD